jgi:hypothetical protein
MIIKKSLSGKKIYNFIYKINELNRKYINYEPMPEHMKKRLVPEFKKEVDQLSRLLNIDLKKWWPNFKEKN